MNGKVAAQTLSSSVADALEFLMLAKHINFTDASGTIKFIRTIDRLFDLIKSRTPFSKGYKNTMWQQKIEQSIAYMIQCRVSSGQRRIIQRQKAFELGLIVTAKSIQQLAGSLVTRHVNL